MTPRGGPAARRALDPAVVVAYLDSLTAYESGGHPRRTRRLVNGRSMSINHSRVVRRWRTTPPDGVTLSAVSNLLRTHKLKLNDLVVWAAAQGVEPILRGQTMLPIKPKVAS